ncbi:MAG: VacJ family lipoprotein [Methylococcales bacterium]|nr:VacJ family lipoprotein [Methylococcales bacterium]
MSITLSACATAPTAVEDKNDPWSGWNRGTQSFNDGLDKAIVKPLAQGYEWITPEFVDEGVTNFFSNINDIGVTINDLLQFKLMQSGMDVSRFLINSTAGVGGFIDVANMVNLPKHKEDFGQTLGFWGVPSGNYLVLPIFGPSSPRDAVGLVGDALMNPLTYVSIFGGAAASAATAGSKVLDVTDKRANLMSTEKIIDEGSVDRYDFIKNSYEQNRAFLVNDGNSKGDPDDPDLLDDGADEPGKPSSKATDNLPSTSGGDTKGAEGSSPSDPDKKSVHFLELSAPQ